MVSVEGGDTVMVEICTMGQGWGEHLGASLTKATSRGAHIIRILPGRSLWAEACRTGPWLTPSHFRNLIQTTMDVDGVAVEVEVK